MNLLQILLTAAPSSEQIAEKAAEDAEKLSSWADQFAGLPVDKVIEKLLTGAVDFALKILAALVVFYVGKFIINRIHKSVRALMRRRHVEKSLATFILSVLKVTLLFLLIIIVISILGIETSSFIALFASAGVAIGMALSGTLQNFAGGVLILLLKPYKVGDFIEAQGFTGTVKEIQIFNTVINTPDNKSIYIPNGGLSTGSINNYSREDYRRVDWTVGISYGDDFDVAKQAILAIIDADDRIVKGSMLADKQQRLKGDAPKQAETAASTDDEEEKPRRRSLFGFLSRKHREYREKMEQRLANEVPHADIDCTPFVALQSLSDSSVDITVRAWVPTEYYWPVYFDVNERIYKELPKAGISFPFPQMDVHIQKN
ncbi:MAG: mechanosensitive ion channel domain-containing protein [Candidatus Limisoma sp.]